MSHLDVANPYRIYWIAWLCLLVVTVVMLFLGNRTLLILGISFKAIVICLWFMHLRYERLDFVLYSLVGMFATAFVLFGLIAPDGLAM